MSTYPTIYKFITRFVGYRFGDDGSVWSRLKRGSASGTGGLLGDQWRKLSGSLDKKGRVKMTLRVNGKTSTQLVNRLILEAFKGPCPVGLECCHNDGNPSNNKVDNLRWDTRRSNQAVDRVKHGTDPVGERNGRHKLTDREVLFVRKTKKSAKWCAKRLCVKRSTIYDIRSGRSWKHLKQELS